jgi:hypothetical protein
MVEFPHALPPIGGPSYGVPPIDQAARAEQDAQDMAMSFDHLHDHLQQLREEPNLMDDGSFIGHFVDDLTLIKSNFSKISQDLSEGKISSEQMHALIGDGNQGGVTHSFYEISHKSIAGLRLDHVMENLDPPPMTDAAHYCQGLATESIDWLGKTMLPSLKQMSQQLGDYRG